jgi:hypothetical protein
MQRVIEWLFLLGFPIVISTFIFSLNLIHTNSDPPCTKADALALFVLAQLPTGKLIILLSSIVEAHEFATY